MLTACVTSQGTGIAGWTHFARTGEQAITIDYLSRFEPVALDGTHGCDEVLHAVDTRVSAPILVVVHGIGGDGPEWENALSMLVRTRPAGVFLFRWGAMEHRDAMVHHLARGLSQLARCSKKRVTLLAHSAGGVLSSFAASQIEVPDGQSVEVVTVASPLAGTLARPADAHDAQLFFLFDLGTRLTHYPPAAPRVAVWHLRTSYPSDRVMKPGEDGVSPNEPLTGVPGATTVDLAPQLSHVGALTWVARRIGRRGWDAWLGSLPSPARQVR